MIRLLNIELNKLRYSRSAKILTITYFILITFLALFASVKFNFGPLNFQLAEQGIFNFPYIWHFNTFIAAILKIFLAVVIISMLTSEYTNRTLKQNLIDGLSKKEFILSKFYTILSYSFISTLFVFVVSLVLGLIFSDYNDLVIIFSDLEYLLAYFVKLVGFFSFCMLLAILVKRSAFALGFLVLWWIIELIVAGVLNWRVFTTETAEKITQFFPLNSMSNLIKEPFSRLEVVQTAANQLGGSFTKDYDVHWYQILIVLCWTAIFVYLSLALLKKRDL